MPSSESSWAAVDRLVGEQKFQEALQETAKIRQRAQEVGDRQEWTRALVKEVQLRTGLHGYETAVRFLKEQPWPEGLNYRAPLTLFYARTLVHYYQGYRWEIDRRERVETTGVVDLKSWTRDQIYAEALSAYQELWAQREPLGAEPADRLAEYLDRNNYPPGIRDTLRDVLSYLLVELLADSSLWRPQESAEVYRLDIDALVRGETPPTAVGPFLPDSTLHPLRKLGYVLADLELWHKEARRPEASLEARLERLRRLHSALTDPGDRRAILDNLRLELPAYGDLPWWSMGKAAEAEFIQSGEEPDRLARARATAETGWRAFPETIGGRRCRNILESIEAPDFSLTSMSTDGLRKRSIEIMHKNLARLWFRAYPLDLEQRIESARDYNLFPGPREQESVLNSGRPAVEWSSELPGTPDYDLHRTFITPPITAPGCYLIAASADSTFSRSAGNRIVSAHFVASDLVLLATRESERSYDVAVLSGETGEPVAGASVSLFRYDWQSGHRRVAELTSGPDGRVRFSYGADRRNESYFLFARKDRQVALDADYIRFFDRSGAREVRASLVFTDRSVYRPLQKIFWKVTVYGGNRDSGKFRTLPPQQVTVSLLDPNRQAVESKLVTTNEFGSAAGEFLIPPGRVLGAWQIETSISGSAHLRVEEYKRPTFEVTLKDPEKPLRLNQPAELVGEARYYFGLPVVSGAVQWRVTRERVYPWWWDWNGWGDTSRAQAGILASGTSVLEADGTFRLRFTPEEDERGAGAGRDLTYRYRIEADLTDEGGETRSASRAFRLGPVSIEAQIDIGAGFLTEQQPASVVVTRTDLNGTPRPGEGTWRLVALSQPQTTSLPAEIPLGTPPRRPGAERFRTRGDGMRPRWAHQYTYQTVLRSWPEGRQVQTGPASHDSGGRARISLPPLRAGAYRLLYETVDDFGVVCRENADFVVAASRTPLALPAIFIAERTQVAVGGTIRLLAHSGLAAQPLAFEIWRDGKLASRQQRVAGRDSDIIEVPVREEHRGGMSLRLTFLRDYQLISYDIPVFVPWDNKEMKLRFSTFRDKLRPGSRETWRVHVTDPDGKDVGAGAAELLAYMYDRSLDIFAPHNPPNLPALYPHRTGYAQLGSSLGQTRAIVLSDHLVSLPEYPSLRSDRLKFYDGYGIGGPGMRYRMGAVAAVTGEVAAPQMAPSAPGEETLMDRLGAKSEDERNIGQAGQAAGGGTESTPLELRADFSETAFWQPQLLTGPDGEVTFEFTVPDSVTSWNVWVHAVTRDLSGASLQREAASVKELMVRPYMPRFLREGDRADLKVVLNNAAGRGLDGKVRLEILDPSTEANLAAMFGLSEADLEKGFSVPTGGSASVAFSLAVPSRPGLVAFKVTAASGVISDGELRPLPVLPGRIHLAQSRFVTLKQDDPREMIFEEMSSPTDPTRIQEQLVINVDAQLFYSVLSSLPYLVHFPYECTEQTLNRFVTTGILSSLYRNYPAVSAMAERLSKRETRLETWDAADPNRKMALEETPWLIQARGGDQRDDDLINVLDPRIAKAERDSSLAKLRKAQTSLGAFPWWPGGPPSPYMTLYIMYGLAKAAEFGVEVPRDLVQSGWSYLAQHYREEYASRMVKEDCCWEFLTFLNYAASCYPDPSWVGTALSAEERIAILDHTFKHWREHSPYLKSMLALTLRRMGRPADAALVFASVLDSARTGRDEGTYWAPEDRSWLWYNDTIETHAFALRTLMELDSKDRRKDGLVQWLFLNKKLNHWKSTRATAEVIYSLVHYLKEENAMGRETVTVRVGGQTATHVFEPDQYTGKKNQTVITGEKLGPDYARVTAEKDGPGLAFASATWHFSTEQLPEQEQGDLFTVSRKYFKRYNTGREFALKPIAQGEALQAGDQVEVHLSIRSRHSAEYVHLRDPRAAGLEPENAVSRFKWDLGIGWYEETRDSGTSFFFERLPAGEYTFKYRLRVNMRGEFRVSPATLQSMYAPEFNAYSSGAVLSVR